MWPCNVDGLGTKANAPCLMSIDCTSDESWAVDISKLEMMAKL